MIDTAGGSTSAALDGEAAIPASPSPTVVHLACPCPGTPHAFDAVTLRPGVTNKMGIAVAAARWQAGGDLVAMEVELGMALLRYGIESWTFTEGPLPEPVPNEEIERWLPFGRGGYEVIEAANALYAEEVFRPFQKRLATRSPATPAAPTTSARTSSGPTRPKRSRRSSRTSSAGKR